MRKLISYIKQPFPKGRKPWQIVLTSSLVIFFLLALFQPFGLSNILRNKWLIITGFTFVTAISTTIIGYIFPLIFRTFYKAENWTIGKNILNNILIIFTIGTGNFVFDWVFTNRETNTFLGVLSAYILITLLIGVIPATISTFIIQNNELKNNLDETRRINNKLLNSLKSNHISKD